MPKLWLATQELHAVPYARPGPFNFRSDHRLWQALWWPSPGLLQPLPQFDRSRGADDSLAGMIAVACHERHRWPAGFALDAEQIEIADLETLRLTQEPNGPRR